MVKRDYRLPARYATPMMTGYRPDVDITEVLDAETANYHQLLMRVL
jgi:hypothetical protein